MAIVYVVFIVNSNIYTQTIWIGIYEIDIFYVKFDIGLPLLF